jgi:peptide/nickel transport system permease protein
VSEAVAAAARAAAPLQRVRRRTLGTTEIALIAFGLLVTALLVIAAIIGPAVAPYDPLAVSLGERLLPPSFGGPNSHWLGTDQLGRDIFARILHAARVTISISLAAVTLTAIVGFFFGVVSGYFLGRADLIVSRIVDVQLAFPTILLAITIVAVFGTSIPMLIIVFVIAGWVRYVRIIRAQTLVLREMQFVEASRAIGASSLRIIARHLFPNLGTEIVILMNLEVGRIILLESSLSYLGLGVQPPLPTWGNMLNEGRLYLQTSWWVVTFPGVAIMLTVLGVNLASEGLRSFYDPRQRGR